MGEQRIVSHLDGYPVMQGNGKSSRFRRIARQGDIYGQPDIGLNAVSAGFGASCAHLFLHREHKVAVVFHSLQPLQGFHHHKTTDSIVHGARHGCVFRFHILAIVDTCIANGYPTQRFFLGFRSDIQVQMLQLRLLDGLLLFLAYNADPSIPKDKTLSNGDLHRNAANIGKPYKTLIVHVSNHQADLIHMAGNHHLGTLALFAGDHVAKGIHSQLIDIFLNLFLNIGNHFFFMARGTIDPCNFFKSF